MRPEARRPNNWTMVSAILSSESIGGLFAIDRHSARIKTTSNNGIQSLSLECVGAMPGKPTPKPTNSWSLEMHKHPSERWVRGGTWHLLFQSTTRLTCSVSVGVQSISAGGVCPRFAQLPRPRASDTVPRWLRPGGTVAGICMGTRKLLASRYA